MADVTMLEAAKYAQDELERTVAKIIVEQSPVLEYLPMRTINGPAYRYNREASLGTIGFRGVNQVWTSDAGVINPMFESLVIMGGEIKIDRFEVEVMSNVMDLKADKYEMKSRQAGITFSEQFFEGDTAVDPYGFDGIRKRILTTGNQYINAATGGATLTLAMVDELIDTIVGGPDALFMNKFLRRKMTALARASGNSETIMYNSIDAFGKQMSMYNGIPIRIVERMDDASTFLDFDENDGSGNMDTASIYAIKFGTEYCHGIQHMSMPSVRDFGEVEAGPYHLGRLEWYVGLVVKHPRSIARLAHLNEA